MLLLFHFSFQMCVCVWWCLCVCLWTCFKQSILWNIFDLCSFFLLKNCWLLNENLNGQITRKNKLSIWHLFSIGPSFPAEVICNFKLQFGVFLVIWRCRCGQFHYILLYFFYTWERESSPHCECCALRISYYCHSLFQVHLYSFFCVVLNIQ